MVRRAASVSAALRPGRRLVEHQRRAAARPSRARARAGAAARTTAGPWTPRRDRRARPGRARAIAASQRACSWRCIERTREPGRRDARSTCGRRSRAARPRCSVRCVVASAAPGRCGARRSDGCGPAVRGRRCCPRRAAGPGPATTPLSAFRNVVLPAAVGPDQPEDLAVEEVEAHAVDRAHATELHPDVVGFEHGLGRRPVAHADAVTTGRPVDRGAPSSDGGAGTSRPGRDAEQVAEPRRGVGWATPEIQPRRRRPTPTRPSGTRSS